MTWVMYGDGDRIGLTMKDSRGQSEELPRGVEWGRDVPYDQYLVRQTLKSEQQTSLTRSSMMMYRIV
jgi:hypothetical protein